MADMGPNPNIEKYKWVNYLLAIVGLEKCVCPRCDGTGRMTRDRWCWPCQGTGTQTYKKKEGPHF